MIGLFSVAKIKSDTITNSGESKSSAVEATMMSRTRFDLPPSAEPISAAGDTRKCDSAGAPVETSMFSGRDRNGEIRLALRVLPSPASDTLADGSTEWLSESAKFRSGGSPFPSVAP